LRVSCIHRAWTPDAVSHTINELVGGANGQDHTEVEIAVCAVCGDRDCGSVLARRHHRRADRDLEQLATRGCGLDEGSTWTAGIDVRENRLHQRHHVSFSGRRTVAYDEQANSPPRCFWPWQWGW
jgi:hypothetical protein